MIEVPKYIPDSDQLLQLSQSVMINKAIRTAIEIKADEIQREIDQRPMLTDDIKKDLRYLMGLKDGVKWLAKLQNDAREYVVKLDANEGV